MRAMWKVLATLGCLLLVGAGVYGVRHWQQGRYQSACALMSDAIGLYPGNDVTMRGVRVGNVTAVTPDRGAVRVAFRLQKNVVLPANAAAVTTSDSIVAERRLELPELYTSGTRWDMRQCIPLARTRTPKSVSQAYEAFEKLSREVTTAAAKSPGQQEMVRDAMNRLRDAIAGTGPAFNDAVAGLGKALGQPTIRDAQVRSLVTNTNELSKYFVEKWPEVEAGMASLGKFAITFREWFSELNPTVVESTQLTPSLIRLIQEYSPTAFALLDAFMPLVERIPTQSIVDLLKKLPPLFTGLRGLGRTGGALTVAPPRFRVSAAAGTCAAVNRAFPQSCREASGGHVDADLLRLVMASGGGAR